MPFKDVLAEILATEGAVFPDGMADTLSAAYDEDFGISAGAIEALNATNGELNEQINKLKIRLHDYMTQEAALVANNTDDGSEDPEDSEDEEPDFDGFFSDTRKES